MDTLEKLIQTLTPQESRDFKFFLNRYPNPHADENSPERKDCMLYDIIRSEEVTDSDNIMMEIYGTLKEKNAYHLLRKRLRIQIEDFIFLYKKDENVSFHVSKFVSIALNFLKNKVYKEAWYYFRKAEEKALESRSYDLLNHVYNVIMSNYKTAWMAETFLDITLLLERSEKNLQQTYYFTNQKMALLHFYSLTRNRLIKIDPTITSIDKVANEILKRYSLNKNEKTDTNLPVQMALLTAEVFIKNKKYALWEKFLISKYHEFEKKQVFNNSNIPTKKNFIYQICGALIQNKKYETAEKYVFDLIKLAREGEFPSTFFCKELLFEIYFKNGRIEKAGHILKEIEKTSVNKPDIYLFYYDIIHYYFSTKQFRDAIKYFSKIQFTDKVFISVYGDDGILNKEIAECIPHYELENYDFVLSRINFIEKKYRKFLEDGEHKKEAQLLSILKQLARKPELIKDKKFIQEASKFKNLKSLVEVGNINNEVINYSAWLTSLLDKRNYYDIFLEIVN
jgi:hypothetical protein